MSLHPEIQREVQNSIDRVCEGRLPEFGDYGALPLVHAVVKECLRWRPALPLGECVDPCRLGASLTPG